MKSSSRMAILYQIGVMVALAGCGIATIPATGHSAEVSATPLAIIAPSQPALATPGVPTNTPSNAPTHVATATPNHIASRASAPRPDPRTTVTKFLEDVRDANTDAVWSALHPDAQAAWGTKDRCTSFYKLKFGPMRIASFQIGDVSDIGPWSNAVAGLAYPSAVTVSVSLTVAQDTGREDRTITGRPMVLVDDGTRWHIAQAGAAGADGAIILPKALPARFANIPILMYHHVAPRPTRAQFRGDYDFRLADSLTVSPDDFARQLDSLGAAGYHAVTPHAVLNALLYDTPLPDNPIALTFDDGYLDNFTYALPPLRQRHMVGTFNVIVAKIGASGPDLQYMSWENLNQMVALGMDVQSHTMTHPDLGTLSDDAALHELVDSRLALQEHLHIGVDFITYPSGEPFRNGSIARQQRLLRLLTSSGYAGGMLAPNVSTTGLDARRPFELMRVRVSGGETLTVFMQSLGPPNGHGDPIRVGPAPLPRK